MNLMIGFKQRLRYETKCPKGIKRFDALVVALKAAAEREERPWSH